MKAAAIRVTESVSCGAAAERSASIYEQPAAERPDEEYDATDAAVIQQLRSRFPDGRTTACEVDADAA